MDVTGGCTDPPPDFLLLDSPNEGEAGTFACPFDGCDGVVCGSAQECHIHLKEWHSPPYACAGCEAYFAAQPALARHVKATGHQKWVCAKNGCELKGFEFESHLEYRKHVIVSTSHRSLGQRDGTRYPDKVTDPDETLSEGSAEDYFLCIEPCCCRYLQQWTERMYEVHVKSHCHVAAIQEEEALRRKHLSVEELEQKREARRTFLCDVRGCPQFGKCLATSHSYYYHIQTWSHLFPVEASVPKKDDDDDFWLQPEARHCTVHGCLQFGRRFTTETIYQRHIKSVQHLRAACRQPTRSSPRIQRVNRRLFVTVQPADEGDIGEDADDEMGDYDEARQQQPGSASTAACSSSTEPSSLPNTPSCMPPLTPDPGLASPSPSRPRHELFLERRNRQLEEEVQRLQAQMDWLCRQN
ncbi:hypothetical protein HRG_006184 [Hirsutella rhossiliensis]|uniref:C2H2-type domain-containing protein n=1 Tax=Hirsutella rhossiliensis TaxID=111463 RepID=A0A9P8N0F8_9HYPO|nr:uncharacterized protein HRG_06184 [Hirsutella rhossiliensis]KAH0963674.1 hypothetical protein HRG_06184 [Hirsutella rhossiliensis]